MVLPARRRPRWACLLGAFGAAATLGGMRGAVATEADRPAVVTAVAGIVSYTRWPADTAPMRLCTIGEGSGVAELLRAADLGTPQRPIAVQTFAPAGPDAPACHAIYVGRATSAATREVLRRYAGQPVLLLGEGSAFCSDGGMFCLEPGAAQVRFSANLDAIARSGLRVNPLVLRIARGASGSGS